ACWYHWFLVSFDFIDFVVSDSILDDMIGIVMLNSLISVGPSGSLGLFVGLAVRIAWFIGKFILYFAFVLLKNSRAILSSVIGLVVEVLSLEVEQRKYALSSSFSSDGLSRSFGSSLKYVS
ncbi:13098_t:CDS:2, partial [Racocetra persica]